MKRFLIPLLATFSALSAPSATASLCPEMFKEKEIYGYEFNQSKSFFEVWYSTEANKKNPNTIYSDFSNWKKCNNIRVKKKGLIGLEIYCDNQLLIDGGYCFGFCGSWFDKNGREWEFGAADFLQWDHPKKCTRQTYFYSDAIKNGYITYIKRLGEHWAFSIKETRYFEAIARPEF